MKFTFPPETRVLDGYTIKRAIHRGGFGEVYYALSDAGREVALKLLQNNSDVELRGVQQCLNLSHPNLVTIFDVRQDADKDHWIIMEYIGGETLDAAIRRHPQGMPMEVVRKWLPGIAAGVAYLHSRGLVHRDLKPANVFSDAGAVKVGDVGLSKFITPSRRSAHTQSVGTVYYMAPEVAKGRYGKEVDVYALGIILFEMLTGRVPFDGESTAEILMKHLSEPPDLRALPPRLQPVLAKALQKDPARRHASIEEFARAFEDAVLGKSLPLAAGTEPSNSITRLPTRDNNDRIAALKPVLESPSQGLQRPQQAIADTGSPDRADSSASPWTWRTSAFGVGATFAFMLMASTVIRGIRDGIAAAVWTGLAVGAVCLYAAIRSPHAVETRARAREFAARSSPPSSPNWHALVPTFRGWLWVLGGGLLFAIGTRTSGSESFAYFLMGLGFGYITYSAPRVFARHEWPFDRRDGEVPAMPAGLHVAATAVPSFQPLAATPFAWRTRMAHWVTSAALSTGIGGGLVAGMAWVAPSLFSLTPGAGVTPELIAYFGATTLIAAWLLSFAVKATEGVIARHPEGSRDGLRRLALICAGLSTGAAAWGLGNFLNLDLGQVYAGQEINGVFDSLGERPLAASINGRSAPTLLGFLVFFGSLFGLRSWWRQVDLRRESRFRAASVLMTVLVSWLCTAVFAFPQDWGLLWAAVISATVQLASPWSPRVSVPTQRNGR